MSQHDTLTLEQALRGLLATGGVIAEASDGDLQAAIDDPHAEEIIKAQAAAILKARAALAARELGVTESTVERHLENARDRNNAKTTTQVCVMAVKEGLIK